MIASTLRRPGTARDEDATRGTSRVMQPALEDSLGSSAHVTSHTHTHSPRKDVPGTARDEAYKFNSA